ncbi:Serine threonine-kinase Chk2 [Hyphodiscus hymeniophilus]|uniref:Serine threonine-kinase Chk2 n=1 Tax=Hyphodiscus hymeniophilus TaxID=353542 RepID=A0A9P6VJ06_9HELO|nr:Serine threonine-kinase Chk2 [Hyphodiscus hymeniophilus]
MSQETTQDLTQSPLKDLIENVFHEPQEMTEDGSECIATLWFEDVVGGEKRELALYPNLEFIVGRESRHEPPTYGKTVLEFAIYDGRVSKRHFRIYSIIYEQKSNSNTQSDTFPPLVYCEDLESSNGTYVNEVLIGMIGTEKTAHLLCDGDVISIRPSWQFTFHQSNHQMVFPTTAQSKDLEHFVDRYVVSDRILGSGQFGNVYLAKKLPTNKQIACKIIELDNAMQSVAESRPGRSGTGALRRSGVGSAKQHRKRVLQEIDILSKLSHPNIINIQKAFCSLHALYIFTDLAPAGDLYSYAQSHGGHLDDHDARVVTKQITLALDYLHSQDVVHRDIKPENVLVTSTDFGGRVMLTDFGFATYATICNGRMGRMHSKVGTLGFVAPEVEYVQKTNLGYTKAADLWSLGVLTASLLTGAMDVPHEELEQLSQVAIANRFLGIEDSYARQNWIQMPPRALKFVRKLLVIDPETRMSAAEALQHSWYTDPVREAQALDEGLQRINRFWEKRLIPSDEVLEALPGVVLSSSTVAEAPGPKRRRKLPDATSSPYFGLDRHLTQKVPSSRNRLLEDLNESGSQFLTFPEARPPKVVANISAQIRGTVRVVSAEGTDLFRMSPREVVSGPGGGIDVNRLGSASTVDLSDTSAENDDLDSMNYTLSNEKQVGSRLSAPARQLSGAAKLSSLEGVSRDKRCKISGAEPRNSETI